LFSPPPQIYKFAIYFNISENNQIGNYSTTLTHTFSTLNEAAEHKQKFLLQLVALLSAVVFSIPSAAVAFKNLSEKHKPELCAKCAIESKIPELEKRAENNDAHIVELDKKLEQSKTQVLERQTDFKSELTEIRKEISKLHEVNKKK
jgi:hypothetical protein